MDMETRARRIIEAVLELDEGACPENDVAIQDVLEHLQAVAAEARGDCLTGG